MVRQLEVKETHLAAINKGRADEIHLRSRDLEK